MKKTLIVLFLLLGLTGIAFSQSATTCPPELVCISPEAARKAIRDDELVKLYEGEIKTKEQAIKDLNELLTKSEKNYIAVSVENAELRKQQVRDAAIIELLLKYVRQKKIGIINF